MAAVRKAAGPADAVSTYNKQLTKVQEINTAMTQAAVASGAWHVQTVKTYSASEALTQAMIKQKVGLKQAISAIKEYRTGQGALNEVIKEQIALRNAMSMQMTSSVFGRNETQMLIPRNLGSTLEDARVKYGTINQLLQGAARQTVNWGKNMQWAGRQITVGLTVPFTVAAAAAGALAYKVDNNLTRIAKVYDTTAKSQEGQEQELADLRTSSLQTATRLAGQYGAKLSDVLDTEAQLAATGQKGAALQQASVQVTRIATLGELDYQKALNMTIALQTAFKLNTQQLTDSFNFMNSVENATSLSIQDIADAVPRAASAFSALGGTVQDMTVALTAMKESGVNADEAANALKSSTARLINPTAAAVAYFQKTFGVDLNKVVTEANGNILKIIETLAGLTHGYSNLAKQKGIDLIFGKFQFNRVTALWNNLGDAINGVQNQTRKAMDVAGQSTKQWASVADSEISRWQNSIQGKFKRAIAELQAQLVPFGMSMLKVATVIVKVVGSIISGFNNLPGPVKTVLGIFAGFAAVVGPLLMITGILGNLFGNMMLGMTNLANLRLRFKALTVEEAATALNAKTASSAFNTQARSAAYLAQQVRLLTTAMEAQAVASGSMAMTSGGMMMTNGFKRTVVPRSNGSLMYAAGSRGPSGEAIGGRVLSSADRQAAEDMKKSTGVIAGNAAKTKMSLEGAGKAIGVIAAGALVFGTMKKDSGASLNSFLNIALIVGTIHMLFPKIFATAIAGAKKLALIMRGINLSNVSSSVAAGFTRLLTAFRVGGLRGPLGITGQIGQMAPRFATLASSALKIFGPIGILAGGVLIIKKIISVMNDQYAAQKKINQSAKDWADILQYTYTPGVIAGKPDHANTMATDIELAGKLKSANEDLANSLETAGAKGDKFATAYRLAMQEALKAVTSGATVQQARQVMEVALTAAGARGVVLKRLMVKFDKIDLSDPGQVSAQISKAIESAFNDVPHSIDAMNGSWFRNFLGGNLDDSVRKTASEAGQMLATQLAATADPGRQGQMMKQFQNNMDAQFSSSWDYIYKNSDKDLRKKFNKLGVSSMATLQAAVAEQAKNNNFDLLESLDDKGKSALKSYQEFYQVVLQSLVDSGTISQKQMDKIMNSKSMYTMRAWGTFNFENASLSTLAKQLGMVSEATTTAGDAQKGYLKQINDYAMVMGHQLPESLKLEVLNIWRAKAGLGAATSTTQGFAAATDSAASSASDLAGGLDKIAANADQAASYLKNTMSGTMDDVYQEADRRFQEQEDNAINGIRARGDKLNSQLEAQGKNIDKYYSDREDALQAANDAASKAQQKRFKAEQDALSKSYDARIAKVQAEIDAEQKADDVRQRIFDAAQERASRLATTANANVDFQSAINSGNLDEAAKAANSAIAQQQQWNLQDAQSALDAAAKKREDALSAQIDSINKAKDAALTALQDRQAAEDDALKAQQDRAEKSLKIEQQNAQDKLSAAKDANQKATDDAVKNAQAQFDAQRRSLQMSLAALQAFVPRNEAELKTHIAAVEALYAKYGLTLETQGNGWATFIGQALQAHMKTATVSLQNDINWGNIGDVISSRLSSGVGVSASDLQYFLKHGTFPDAQPLNDKAISRLGLAVIRHSGGDIGWSQADRVGIPRSSSLYPSEVPAILKRGEFVVNEVASQKYRSLLQTINQGGGPAVEPGDGRMITNADLMFRHNGGMAETGPLILGSYGEMLGQTIENGVLVWAIGKMISDAVAASETSGTSMFTGAMTSTIQGALDWARQQQGKPYIWGGAGPEGADCSGFMSEIADFILGKRPAYGRIFATSSMTGGPSVVGPFVRGGGPQNAFRIGVTPNSHTAGTLGGVHVESGSGHGPMVGGSALGAESGFTYMYYLPQADKIPQLYTGGEIRYEGVANLHPRETVLSAPLSSDLKQGLNNMASGDHATYEITIDLRGATVSDQVDMQRAVEDAINAKESRLGRKRRIT